MVCEIEEGKLGTSAPEIDYSYLDKDLLDEAHLRLLWQFRNSSNICEVLTALFTEIQLLFDTATDVLDERQLAKARGEQLNVLGRIVGQDRIVVGASESIFGFADDATALPFAEIIDGESVGGGRWLELGEPETGTRELTDGEYRQFIIAKIFRNHIQTASVCELTRIANLILTSVTKTQIITLAPAVIAYHFTAPSGLTPDDIAIIVSVIDNNKADRQRIITAGAGIGIEYYSTQGDTVFGWDDDPDPAVGGWEELSVTEIMFGMNDSPSPKGWYREKEGTTGAGVYADRPNKESALTVTVDGVGAPWAEILT